MIQKLETVNSHLNNQKRMEMMTLISLKMMMMVMMKMMMMVEVMMMICLMF